MLGRRSRADQLPPPATLEIAHFIEAIATDTRGHLDERLRKIKQSIVADLISTISLAELALLERDGAREAIREVVSEIVNLRGLRLSAIEQKHLADEFLRDIFGSYSGASTDSSRTTRALSQSWEWIVERDNPGRTAIRVILGLTALAPIAGAAALLLQ